MAEATGKGLEGVVAAETRISDVDGREGKLFYAGYDIADLAEHATFEETIHLLHHLELPTAAELAETVATLRAESVLEPLLVELVGSLAERTGLTGVADDKAVQQLFAGQDPRPGSSGSCHYGGLIPGPDWMPAPSRRRCGRGRPPRGSRSAS